jgi:type II secretory pathway pseudopilin PulG
VWHRNRLEQNQTGFTLIELLLYIAIAPAIILAGTLFLSVTLNARVKNQAVNEVEQQGSLILQQLAQAIRSSEAINAPAAGSSAASLSLDALGSSNDPTLFNLNANTLQITEGSNPAIDLSNSRVSITALSFQNVSYSGTPGLIRISFKLSHENPSTRPEYNYSKTFETSAGLRQP